MRWGHPPEARRAMEEARTTSPVPIGLFTRSWLPYSETFIYDQLKQQRRLHSHVFTRWSVPEFSNRFPYENVTTLSPLEGALCEAVGLSPSFSRGLKSSGARLIHAHFGLNGVYARPFARALDIPLVVTFHGHDVPGLLPKNRFTTRYARYQLLASKMFDQASLLLCASQELADMLVNDVGAPEAKIRVHRLGIDIQNFEFPDRSGRPEKEPLVLLIGRFVEKKGIEYALQAFAEARKGHPLARLRIVGDGPLKESLYTLTRGLGIAEFVDFLGVLTPKEVREQMQEADLLMAPSVVARNGDRESGVIVLKEAGACGLPTLGTRHGGIPEIIEHGVTGYLVPERQVAPLASHLSDLLGDRGARLKMGQRARARISSEYNTVQQNARLEELLCSVL